MVRIALLLNVGMFVIGTTAGVLSQSNGLLADALDMLTDAIAYVLALMAITRGPEFKKNAARWRAPLPHREERLGQGLGRGLG